MNTSHNNSSYYHQYTTSEGKGGCPVSVGDSNLKTVGHDSRSRDIKRRLEVIQKKMADLQELGVPCGFCYVSVRNSSTLFTMGHPSITQPIEQSRDLILQHLSEPTHNNNKRKAPLEGSYENLTSEGTSKEIHMLLPPLPAPLEELGLPELRNLVVGIVKDLGLKWTDPKPSFWPENIPFQYPRNIPEGYQGCWTHGLRQVLHSIYTYFNIHHHTHPTTLTSSSSTISSSSPSLSPPFDSRLPVFNGLPTVTTRPIMAGVNEEDEEDEEVDVGTPEDAMGVVIPPPTHSDNESINDEDEEGAELNTDRPPLSYFGYELAQSESSHASSPITSHTPDEATPTETALSYLTSSTNSKSGLSLLQPHVIYCPPGLYSQLYPALSLPTATTTPLLLPLMKQLYVPPTRTSRDESPPTLSPRLRRADETSEPVRVTSRHTSPPPTHTNYAPRPHPPPSKCPDTRNFPSEPKNRKSKNGMYIYTNPSAPLQFMSLNTRPNHTHSTAHASDTPKSSAHRSSNVTSRKLVAGAPVSPHTGEPVAVRETVSYHHTLRQTATPPSESEMDMPSAPRSPPTSRKVQTNTLKKKRELVFHWYKSPEAPPTTKRPRLLDTHGNQSVV